MQQMQRQQTSGSGSAGPSSEEGTCYRSCACSNSSGSFASTSSSVVGQPIFTDEGSYRSLSIGKSSATSISEVADHSAPSVRKRPLDNDTRDLWPGITEDQIHSTFRDLHHGQIERQFPSDTPSLRRWRSSSVDDSQFKDEHFDDMSVDDAFLSF